VDCSKRKVRTSVLPYFLTSLDSSDGKVLPPRRLLDAPKHIGLAQVGSIAICQHPNRLDLLLVLLNYGAECSRMIRVIVCQDDRRDFGTAGSAIFEPIDQGTSFPPHIN